MMDEPEIAEEATPRAVRGRAPRRLPLLLCGFVVVVLAGVVAILQPVRPGTSAAPDEGSGASDAACPDATEPAGRMLGGEGACSRPAGASELAVLVQADAAFDAGDFQHARDLYLDLLLVAGDFGESGDAIVNWAHGRLALALARIARPADAALIDEPPLSFREVRR